MKTTTNFQMLKLADISIGSTNPRNEFDKESIEELSKSIIANGVIQPVVVRPGKKKGYELVCGERRHRASILAKMAEIPAIVRELTDDQALELQITENLQRKDIHPMDEAVAFKHWQEMKKYTIQDIAKRVGKSDKYVSGRLKLNGLIPEFQKALYKDNLKLADALLLLKLSPETQKEYFKEECVGAHEIEISYNIDDYMGDLKDAPFSIKDATLKKNMGACTTCQFNSANTLLFAGDKEATCGLLKCFTEKSKISFDREIKKALEDKDVVLVSSAYYKNDEAKEFIKQGHEVFDRNNYNIVKKTDKKAIKAFCVEGNEKGTYRYIKMQAAAQQSSLGLNSADVQVLIKDGKATSKMIDEETSKIKERLVRGKEIIEEVIAESMYKGLELVEEGKPGTFVHNKALNQCETVALIFILKNKCYGEEENIFSKYKLDDGEEDLYAALMDTTPDKLEEMIRMLTRQVILDNYSHKKGHHPANSHEVLCIEDCMKIYAPANAKQIREVHEERLKGKEKNAALKIEKLQLAKKSTEKADTKKVKA
jgi:ParB/RepB/Spo0J family partition protein